MAENTPATPEQTAPPTQPNTPDIVHGNAKEIKELQTRLSQAEKRNQDILSELGGLRDIVKKLGELPPTPTPQPATTTKPKNLLEQIEDLIWPSTKG